MATIGLNSYNESFEYKNTDINLIFVFHDSVIYCKTIDNSKLQLKNIEELENYLINDKDVISRKYTINELKLEEKYLSELIARYSKKYNNGFIDWRYKYNDISFKRMNKLVYNPIAIKVNVNNELYPAGGGIGENIDKVSSLLSFIYKIIKRIYIRKKTYKFFEYTYGVNKEFITKVIKNDYIWKKGFIDTNIYRDKDIYERKIMKDCNYKYSIKEKSWKKNT